MKSLLKRLFTIIVALQLPALGMAQEYVVGLSQNAVLAKSEKQLYRGNRAAVKLPFLEDFSNYTGYPSSRLWMDAYAYVNRSFAIYPPSIGVATLDALDADGKVYAHASRDAFPADTLTSCCIRLDSNFAQHRPMNVGDSLYFSFYYQPAGGCSNIPAVEWERIGDAPELNDKLILEFGYATGNMVFIGYEYIEYILGLEEYHVAGDTIDNPFMPGNIYIFESSAYPGETILMPIDSLFGPEFIWNEVWSTNGCTLDSWLAENPLEYFKQVLIPITDPQYLRNNFQFRFRNYASLDLDSWSGNNIVGWSSNCDQWNIDYIHLDVNRNNHDLYPNDVAFVSPTTSALKLYQSMPWNQFRASDMATSFHNDLSNLASSTKNTFYNYSVYKYPNEFVYRSTENNENAAPYYDNGLHTYPNHANPSIDFSYNYDGADSASFIINHVFRMEGSNDACKSNDTCRFEQKFYNYYAYDDGTAEGGYCLYSTMTSPRSYLAVQFNLAQPDTLRCVRFWFNRTFEDENVADFTLMVWDDNGGLPGNVLYEGPATLPGFAEEYLDFVNYYPEEPIAVEGTFYVGFFQDHNVQLNLGFDQNNDARGHFFYKISNEWNESYYKGAPMIRPVLGKAYDHSGVATLETSDLRWYPNPTCGELQLTTDAISGMSYEVVDMYGRILESNDLMSTTISLRNYSPGVYFIRLLKGNQILSTEKIIKQ